MICVECGAEAPRLIGGSCPACFVAKNPLLLHPPTLDVELCAHCDARHVGAHWVDPDEGDPLDAIREQAVRAHVRVHPEARHAVLSLKERAEDERHFRYVLSVEATVEGTPVAAGGEVLVRMKRSVCDRCSRMFGGFYAAVLQLRATERALSEEEVERAHRIVGGELDRLRAAGNREAFLAKSGAVPGGGFDYYLGDIEAGRIVARLLGTRLGASVVETAKLVGRKEGDNIYRVTFLIRIRLFSAGDFAKGGNRVYEVASLERGRAVVWDLESHLRDRAGEEALRRIGGPEVLEEAVLVSRSGGAIQVLDPQTLRTVDLVPPPEWEPDGESVWVLRHEERLYLPHTKPRPRPTPQKKAK